MRVTKDEARILAEAMEEFKHKVIDDYTKDDYLHLFNKLIDLQHKLETFGDDKRRQGRTSQDDFSDLLKRFSK